MSNERGGKSGFSFGPTDKQWLPYVVGWSLLNLWVGVLLLASSTAPLKTVGTDGSLLVFCIVTMALTMGSVRQELKRCALNKTDGDTVASLRARHDKFCAFACVTLVVVLLFYTQFIGAGSGLPFTSRVVASAIAVLVGLVYAREALALAHEASVTARVAS